MRANLLGQVFVVALIGLVCSNCAEAQTNPGPPSFAQGDYSECGKNASEDLAGGNRNVYWHGGTVLTDEAAEINMKVLFDDKLADSTPTLDLNYWPQLYDLLLGRLQRAAIAIIRAGKDPEFQPLLWARGSPKYLGMRWDENFRMCCVLQEDQGKDSLTIATNRPDGSGWSGLWEYYFPTTITEWSNQSTETMIVPRPYVEAQLEQAQELLRGEKGVSYVAKGIGHLKHLAETQAEGQGKVDDTGSQPAAKNEVTQMINEIEQKLGEHPETRFTEDISMVGGMVVRPMLSILRPIIRQGIAGYFCMHPDQFMKLMDAEEDPFQKPSEGGDVMTRLQKIPPFGSVFKNGLTLLLDPSELARLNNPFVGRYDQGPGTDIAKGYEVWRNNMLGREAFLSIGGGSGKRKDWPGTGQEALSLQDVLLKAGARPVRPQDVGESFYPQNNIWMVPALMRYHKAPLDRREYNTTPLAFRIAAGLHEAQQGDGTVGTREGDLGYYKKFEPQSYYKFGGRVPEYIGRNNEVGIPCRRRLTNETIAKVKPDRIILSHKTHNFVKDPVDEATLDQNMRSQTTDDPSRNLKAGDTPNKCGRDMQRHNYAANMTIHRTCPKGYVVWKPPLLDPMFLKKPTIITPAQFGAMCKGEKLW